MGTLEQWVPALREYQQNSFGIFIGHLLKAKKFARDDGDPIFSSIDIQQPYFRDII
jgi:hypothetical protein